MTKLATLKQEVYAITKLTSIKQIKYFYPMFKDLSFRKKETWQLVLDYVKYHRSYSLQEQLLVTNAITIDYREWEESLKQPVERKWAKAASRLRKQYNRKHSHRFNIEKGRGFAKVA